MTKVTILGQKPKEKELKKIELIECLQPSNGQFLEIKSSSQYAPSDYNEIILLTKNKFKGFNIMLCLNQNEDNIWLGHFNDGIV